MALIGFGAKAGIVPAHVWLPEAHPAAPSHASALMSGAMIKVGIYGLIRMLTFLGPPQPWWGWLLIAIGASSGVLGVLFGVAQHDLKRLLAYSSVENIGIIFSVSVSACSASRGSGPPRRDRVCRRACCTSSTTASSRACCFLVPAQCSTRPTALDFEQLGGLLKRMPWTGTAFLIGPAAIVGLPPFNGFVGEFLLFFGLFAVAQPAPGIAVPAWPPSRWACQRPRRGVFREGVRCRVSRFAPQRRSRRRARGRTADAGLAWRR